MVRERDLPQVSIGAPNFANITAVPKWKCLVLVRKINSRVFVRVKYSKKKAIKEGDKVEYGESTKERRKRKAKILDPR